MGEEHTGGKRLTIDGAIPVSWILGVVGAVLFWAASQYFGLHETQSSLDKMVTQITRIADAQAHQDVRDAQMNSRVSMICQRIEMLERHVYAPQNKALNQEPSPGYCGQ